MFFVWAETVFYDQRTVRGALFASLAQGLYFISIVPLAGAFLLFYRLVLAL